MIYQDEFMINEHLKNLKRNSNIIIATHKKLNESQKIAFNIDFKFNSFLRTRINTDQEFFKIDKTTIILILIIKTFTNRKRIIICIEKNFVVRLCVDIIQ